MNHLDQAEVVRSLLEWMRSQGFTCAQVTVGDVTIAGLIDTRLVAATGSSDVTVTQPAASTAADLYRRYGGKAYEELLDAAEQERGGE